MYFYRPVDMEKGRAYVCLRPEQMWGFPDPIFATFTSDRASLRNFVKIQQKLYLPTSAYKQTVTICKRLISLRKECLGHNTRQCPHIQIFQAALLCAFLSQSLNIRGTFLLHEAGSNCHFTATLGVCYQAYSFRHKCNRLYVPVVVL